MLLLGSLFLLSSSQDPSHGNTIIATSRTVSMVILSPISSTRFTVTDGESISPAVDAHQPAFAGLD